MARHLAMSALLIDSDPEAAHAHATSASRRGGRIAMVRETLAITAYATGDFALALRELRTYRRISGKDDQLALMIDSERGLGRPDRALELGRSIDLAKLPAEERVNVAIAMSGARLDQGNADLALAELEIEQLDRTRAFSYSPALFLAYAEVLGELGRTSEQADWERLAERAETALEAVQQGEHERIEVISEELQGEELAAYIEQYGDPFADEAVEDFEDDSDEPDDLPSEPESDTSSLEATAARGVENGAPAPVAESAAESAPEPEPEAEAAAAVPVSTPETPADGAPSDAPSAPDKSDDDEVRVEAARRDDEAELEALLAEDVVEPAQPVPADAAVDVDVPERVAEVVVDAAASGSADASADSGAPTKVNDTENANAAEAGDDAADDELTLFDLDEDR